MRKLLFAAVLLAACTPQKRLARLINRNPALIDTFTSVVLDTAWSIRYTHDTTFTQVKEIDTMFSENDTIQTIIYKTHDVIRIRTVVKPIAVVHRDTVQRMIVRPVEQVRQPWWAKILPWWIPLGFVAVILHAILTRKK